MITSSIRLGALLGQVNDIHGNPIRIRGLWALQFGLGVANGSSDALFFTAGGESEQHGYFGTLTVTVLRAEGRTAFDDRCQSDRVHRH